MKFLVELAIICKAGLKTFAGTNLCVSKFFISLVDFCSTWIIHLSFSIEVQLKSLFYGAIVGFLANTKLPKYTENRNTYAQKTFIICETPKRTPRKWTEKTEFSTTFKIPKASAKILPTINTAIGHLSRSLAATPL